MKYRWTVMSAVELFKPEHLWQTAASVSCESLPGTHFLHKDSYTLFIHCTCKKHLRFAGFGLCSTEKTWHTHSTVPLDSLSFHFYYGTSSPLTNIANIKYASNLDREGQVGGAQFLHKISQSNGNQIRYSPSKPQFTHSSLLLMKYTLKTHSGAKVILFVFQIASQAVFHIIIIKTCYYLCLIKCWAAFTIFL